MASPISNLVERQAPERIAVVFGDVSLTYGELNARANRLAHSLQRRGIGPESVVGLWMGRSIELLVGVLGVLKAGAAYVPLDPQYPAERLEEMARDAGVALRLTADDVDCPGESTTDPERGAGPANLAYILYTSGSTGKPKGVEVTHANVMNFLGSMREILEFTEREVVLSVTGLTFDIAGLDLYLTWMCGARLVLVPRETVFDGARLGAALEKSGATLLQTTPVTWRMLLAAGWRAPAGFKALCGGEAMPQTLFDDLRAMNVRLWNLYGPTETTIWSTAKEFGAGETRVTCGRAIANTTLEIIDDELWIGGAGVARGYHARPELTAERFVNGKYRTGDRARFAPNGELEIIGRVDHQIKWHGYRIEPGEIEAAICEAAGAKEAVVTLRGDEIVGYVVGNPDLAGLRARLILKLPSYMVPGRLTALERFPLTPNGKLDRKALP